MRSPTKSIHFAGHDWLLDARAALYWPKHQVLIVSDLHLEKASFLAQHGSLVAPYDTHDTLLRLQHLVADYQPQEIIFLGDSFHDRHAMARLEPDAHAVLEAIRLQVPRCSWIEGNHERGFAAMQHFEMRREIEQIVFTHVWEEQRQGPQIIGHYHPKALWRIHGHKISGKCFMHSQQLLIMPAFGTYTGGLLTNHEVFTHLMPEPRQIHLIYQDQLWPQI